MPRHGLLPCRATLQGNLGSDPDKDSAGRIRHSRFLGKLSVTTNPVADLVTVIGVVADRCSNETNRETEVSSRRLDLAAFSNEGLDDLPDIWTTEYCGPSTGRSGTENDAWMVGNPNRFFEVPLSQCRQPQALLIGLASQSILDRRRKPEVNALLHRRAYHSSKPFIAQRTLPSGA